MHQIFWSDQSDSLLSNLSTRWIDTRLDFSCRRSSCKSVGHLSAGWNLGIVFHSSIGWSSGGSAKVFFLKVWSLGMSNWASFNSCLSSSSGSLQLDFLLESGHDIFSVNFFNFRSCILVDKIIDGHVTTTNSYHNLIALLNLNVNPLLAKLVDTFGFSEEEDVHLLSLWIFIDKISKGSIDGIIFLGNINSLISF